MTVSAMHYSNPHEAASNETVGDIAVKLTAMAKPGVHTAVV
jgi:hypothetical protein